MYGILDDNGNLIARFVVPLRVESTEPDFVSDSLSLKRNVRKRVGQRWEVSAPVEPLSSSANELFLLFVKKGNHLTFNIRMPQNYAARISRDAVDAVTASGSVDSTEVTLTTLSTIPAGTFIKFANHSKVYLTLTECVAGGVVDIKPRLRSAVTNAQVFWQDDVVLKAFLDTGSINGMQYNDGILMDNGNLTFVEDV